MPQNADWNEAFRVLCLSICCATMAPGQPPPVAIELDFKGERLADLGWTERRRNGADVQEYLLPAKSWLDEAEPTLGVPGLKLTFESHKSCLRALCNKTRIENPAPPEKSLHERPAFCSSAP